MLTAEAERQLKESLTPSQQAMFNTPIGRETLDAIFFGGQGGAEGASEQTKPTVIVLPYSSGPVVGSSSAPHAIFFGGSSSAPASEQTEPQGDLALATFLQHYSLKHASTAFLPSSLTNRHNWCFVNAIPQALLACPPFYSLMRSLGSDHLQASLDRAPAPMLSSMVMFVGQFRLLDAAVTASKDKVTGLDFEPRCVYNMLLGLTGHGFRVVEGQQEDAEEFLTCLLNGLSNEIQEQIKLVEAQEEEGVQQEGGGEDWQEVGAKGRSCVTRNNLPQTPIQVRKQPSLGFVESRVLSVNNSNLYPPCLRPWPWACVAPVSRWRAPALPRSSPSSPSSSIFRTKTSRAIHANLAIEHLDGFLCDKSKQAIEATCSLSFDELPPVLILHFKRFVYYSDTGQVQKIMKAVDFPIDLEIGEALVSAEFLATTSGTTARSRQYKLFATVSHKGRGANKGHYTSDVFHEGHMSWLHCDDSSVNPTSPELVVAPNKTSTPYLLFYRREHTS